MSRRRVHRSAAVLVLVAMIFVALPAADARPLTGSHPAAAGWLSTFTSWVSGLFASALAGKTGVRATSSSIISTDGHLHTNTGSCVDPNGRPVPCGQG
jgi:hypothetical protein